MSNSVTSADASAAAWRGEAVAAAEAYTQEQSDAAARARDEAERTAGDGVDPPPDPQQEDGDRIFGPTPGRAAGPAASGPATTASPSSRSGGPSGANHQEGTPEPLTPDEVAFERSRGNTVISAGDGTYYVITPFQDLKMTEDTPPEPKLEAPGSVNWLPGSSMPSATRDAGVENPPGGAPEDVPRTESAQETKPAEKPAITTSLGKEVDTALNEILSKSPTLRENLEKLLKGDWTVQWGKVGIGSTDRDEKIISIDSSLKAGLDTGKPLTASQLDKIASVLAHEVGHASHPPHDVAMRGVTEDEYVQRRVDAFLDSEGAAAFENARALHEGGPNGPSIAGLLDERYQHIYNEHTAGRLSEEQAIHDMGQVFGNEINGRVSGFYRDYFIQQAQREWSGANGNE